MFFFSRFCTILSAHSQKTVDFNRNVCCGGVENSFALVPCFPRGNFSTLCSRPGLNLIPPSCSEWFPSVFVLLFTAFYVCFGFRTTAKCFFLHYFAETVCFSLLLFAVTFCVSLSAKKEIARARSKLRLCVPQSRVKAERTKARAQIETKRVE